jgi:hypothetical protein
MKHFNTKPNLRPFSQRSALVVIGLKLQAIHLFEPIATGVHIPQKVVQYTPAQKLQDAFISILAGSHGLVETNKRVRPDHALQRAFGRAACAEQSTISETINCATEQNVTELQGAVKTIYQRFSHGYPHDYAKQWQILDADTSGLPAGKKAELCTKGYFARQRNRRGRQLARVTAARYDEVVVDQCYAGKVQLTTCLQPLILAAEDVLRLDAPKRARTLWRIDAGGGSEDDVNWVLARDYHLLTKDYSAKRAARLAQSVQVWYPDPKVQGREVGLVTQPQAYVRPTTQIAVRARKKNGRWGYAVLITTLSAAEILELLGRPRSLADDPAAVLWAYVYGYDQRAGGVEIQIKGDKQGLGLTKRNKRKFTAQQVVVLLASVAHNVVIWARQWLAEVSARFGGYGIVRMVRDVFQMRGRVTLTRDGRVTDIVLDQNEPLVLEIVKGLRTLLADKTVSINLGEI